MTDTLNTDTAQTAAEVADLRLRLELAWCAETSAYPDWNAERPSKGQCAVTALIVVDHFGGELLRVVNAGDSHYFNRLPDGTEVDLTRDQFGEWDPTPAETREYDATRDHPATGPRYELLVSRLAETPSCTCARLCVGLTESAARNWNPDCELHGVASAHYGRPDATATRTEINARAVRAQRLARLARTHSVTHRCGVTLSAPGSCELCDLYRASHGTT